MPSSYHPHRKHHEEDILDFSQSLIEQDTKQHQYSLIFLLFQLIISYKQNLDHLLLYEFSYTTTPFFKISFFSLPPIR